MTNQCWFCKENDTQETTPVILKNAQETVSVEVPLCQECKSKQGKAVIGFFVLFAIGVIATIATAVVYVMSGADVNGMRTGITIAALILAPTTLLGIFVAKSYVKGTHFPKYAYEHPDVIAKRQEGYK